MLGGRRQDLSTHTRFARRSGSGNGNQERRIIGHAARRTAQEGRQVESNYKNRETAFTTTSKPIRARGNSLGSGTGSPGGSAGASSVRAAKNGAPPQPSP